MFTRPGFCPSGWTGPLFDNKYKGEMNNVVWKNNYKGFHAVCTSLNKVLSFCVIYQVMRNDQSQCKELT